MEAGGAGGEEEHVALAEQEFGALGVEDGAGVHAGPHPEGDAGGEVGLDEAGDDIHGRALGGEDEVHADGTGHLGEAGDGFLDVVGIHDHEVGELVYDDDDVAGRGRFSSVSAREVVEEAGGLVLEEAVELGDVADAAAGEQLEAALHLAGGVAQGVGGELGLGDDGG